ncbi:hypothetical protein [Paenibacillus oleatilyticus]|uniref:Uncharacterized protein n=1 Tax=Paenibacillus oleatilyticus TaxID=2594886 RepID=A0ABV4V062_9BACL
MKRVFYMKTRERVPGDEKNIYLDKIGGVPTHKPEKFPIYLEDEKYGFVMQIYCDKEKFPNIEGVLCWQIYQDVNEEDIPIIIEVPIGAELNTNNEGTPINRLKERIIYYEKGLEPDVLEIGLGIYSDEEEDKYFSSKIGGAIPEDYMSPDFEYIGRMYESIYDADDYGLNFGIEGLNLARNRKGKMELI